MVKKFAAVIMLTVVSSAFGMTRFASPVPQSAEFKRLGRLRVLTGPMACSKTDNIMAIIETWQRMDESKALVFKHSLDTRLAASINTRRRGGGYSIKAYPANDPIQIFELVSKQPVEYVAIDEVQFFKALPMVSLIKALKKMGIFVVVSGLDKDFKGDPFGMFNPDRSLASDQLCMSALLSVAEEVVKEEAMCSVCKHWNATMTQRLVNGIPARITDPLIIIDDGSHPDVVYEPRCAACHQLLE